MGSQLRLGEWLTETFGTEYIEKRRERARRIRELEDDSRMATLAQLAEEDRASRRTVPDVPSGPLLEIIESLSLPQSQVETMPLALPARVKAPAPTDGNPMVILLAAAVVTLFALGILAFFAR